MTKAWPRHGRGLAELLIATNSSKIKFGFDNNSSSSNASNNKEERTLTGRNQVQFVCAFGLDESQRLDHESLRHFK